MAIAAVFVSVCARSTVAVSTPFTRTGTASADLARRLAGASPFDRLAVLVHGISDGSARRASDRAGLTVLDQLESIDVVLAAGPAKGVRAILGDPLVEHVELDRAIAWTLDSAGSAARLAEARDPDGLDGHGHSIAVVDSGVDGTHPMFQRSGRSVVVRNLRLLCLNHPGAYISLDSGRQIPPDVCPDGGRSPGLADAMFADAPTNDSDTLALNGHGTHVASIAGGQHVVIGSGRHIAGVAPGASIVALSVGTALGVYGPVSAFDWLVRHHRTPCEGPVTAVCPPVVVVNNSWSTVGGAPFDPRSAIVRLQRSLVAEGVVVVWGNGNGDATNNGGDGTQSLSNPFGIDPTPGVLTIANYDDADIGTREGSIHPTSSRGKAGDPSTYPDLAAPGTEVVAACRVHLASCKYSSRVSTDPNYGAATGTSMAAPVVSGAVAVLKQAVPGLSPAEIERLLEDSAHRFAAGARYEADPTNAGSPTSYDKGHGLVDLAAAIDGALRRPVRPFVCPSVPVFADPLGDATTFSYPLVDINGVANDPALDIRKLELVPRPVARTLEVVMSLDDLGPRDPFGSSGAAYALRFTVGDRAHTIRAFRRVAMGEARFDADGSAVSGVFDVDADEVIWKIPTTAFRPALGGPTTLTSVSALSGRYLALDNAAAADTAATPCTIRIDVGSEPARGLDAVLSKLSPSYTWQGLALDVAYGDAFGQPCTGFYVVCFLTRIGVDDPGRLRLGVTTDIPAELDLCVTPPGRDRICSRNIGSTEDIELGAEPGDLRGPHRAHRRRGIPVHGNGRAHRGLTGSARRRGGRRPLRSPCGPLGR